MKRIIMEGSNDTIKFSEVSEFTPIFAKKDGILVGMIVKELEGWILRMGGDLGATGYHESLKECIISCSSLRLEFFIA